MLALLVVDIHLSQADFFVENEGFFSAKRMENSQVLITNIKYFKIENFYRPTYKLMYSILKYVNRCFKMLLLVLVRISVDGWLLNKEYFVYI